MMYHVVFQRHHIPPSELHKMSYGEQAFIFASELIHIEEERKRAEERS